MLDFSETIGQLIYILNWMNTWRYTCTRGQRHSTEVRDIQTVQRKWRGNDWKLLIRFFAMYFLNIFSCATNKITHRTKMIMNEFHRWLCIFTSNNKITRQWRIIKCTFEKHNKNKNRTAQMWWAQAYWYVKLPLHTGQVWALTIVYYSGYSLTIDSRKLSLVVPRDITHDFTAYVWSDPAFSVVCWLPDTNINIKILETDFLYRRQWLVDYFRGGRLIVGKAPDYSL